MSQAVQLRDMESLLDQIEDNKKLQNLLESLPDRTRRSVMVPFGSVAFFPGQLVHTNECFVDMGAGVTVEKSTKETVSILRQRQQQLEAQVAALHQQKSVAPQSQQQARNVTPPQAAVQSPDNQQQTLQNVQSYDPNLQPPQTWAPSEHVQQHQEPSTVVTHDSREPTTRAEQQSSSTHQGSHDSPAELGNIVGAGETTADLQHACATDDGDFERMMARFDDLEKQEAAAQNGAVTADAPDSTAQPSHVQQGSAADRQKLKAAAATPKSKPRPGGEHHIKPPTGLKRGFLTGKAAHSTTRTQQAANASSAGHSLSQGSEPQLQHYNACQTTQPAFTGSVVEHVDMSNDRQALKESQASIDTVSQARKVSASLGEALVPVQRSSSGMSKGGLRASSCLGQSGEKVATRRVSKFKQSRSAS